MRLSAILPIGLAVFLAGATSVQADTAAAAPFLAQAQKLLLQGSFSDAAKAFSEALQHDPENYLTHYKRATAYLSIGRLSAALDDFDSILKLHPLFSKAHLEKAKIYAKEGSYDAAKASLKAFTSSDPTDTSTPKELAASIKSAESALGSLRRHHKSKKYEQCVDSATKVLEISPNLAEARELRAECWLENGFLEDGVGELTRLAHLRPSDQKLIMRLSSISFYLLESNTALQHIKQCLLYDPDSTLCKKAHKQLKNLNKDISKLENFMSSAGAGSFSSAIKILFTQPNPLFETFENAMKDAAELYFPSGIDPKIASEPRLKLITAACKAYAGLSQFSKARTWCEDVLSIEPESVDGLAGMGEVYMKDEKWEEAVRAFEKAFELGGRSSQDMMNKLEKARRLLKQSKAKDYYKILGVSRDADPKTIKKAYRTAAKSAHPDKGGSEAKMAALNEAFEVLSNPELKARFDNGDDPNDTSQPQGGQGNPFNFHGGHPFQHFQQGGGGFPGGFPGGGGGGQKFHFQYGG